MNQNNYLVCAVITTFAPDDSFHERIQRVSDQVDHVVIVDDSGEAKQQIIGGSNTENIHYFKNKENRGIAFSLNSGIRYAIELGCNWILTLDDDSLISETYISDLFEFYGSFQGKKPGILALSRGHLVENDSSDAVLNDCYAIKRTLITSGSLFSVDIFEKVTGFNEGLFIDLVDFDFCTKIRQCGYSLIQLSKIGLDHKVGNSKTVKFLFFNLTVYNHNPFRLYYQVRNVFFFLREYFSFDPLLSIFIFFDLVRLPLKSIFFESQKIKRLKFQFRGLVDGLRGRTGKLK